MIKSVDATAQRRKLLGEIARLAEIAIFGTLSETYRTCGRAGCHCQGDGPKHGPHLNVSYRGEQGKTTGYYVPKGAEESTRQGVAIAVIALWLGHESIETTNVYLHANLAMKEKALAKLLPVGKPFRRYQANDTVTFLESL